MIRHPARLPALALALLVVLSGCTFGSPFVADRGGLGEELGREGGYAATDPLSVTASDGLNASEREAVVARTMARVELIRGLEFVEPVPVEVISRQEYRDRRAGRGSDEGGEAYGRWNDQVWEAAFLVGEETPVSEALDTVLSSSVAGFYSPRQDRIVVVSDAETPTLDRATLAHELVHALQDQHLSFGGERGTQDLDLAEDGLVEGDANTVEAEYEARCGSRWDCLPRPDRSAGRPGESFNRGVFLTVYAPYAAGPDFVRALRERGGWTAVNEAYDAFPVSTEQVIHPRAYPDEQPVVVPIPDRSGEGYERFDLERETDTLGEATIYATFRANGVVPESHSTYNYSQRLSAGWGGDTVVPYRGADGEDGYVWRSTWDSPADAREFLDGYRAVLDEHGAAERGDGVYVIESGPYADAFRVVRRDETVTVVNAPTVEDLDAVHARR